MTWVTRNGQPYNDDWPKLNELRRADKRKKFMKKWITVWRLKNERNWTDAAIKKYLGDPKNSNGYKVFSMAKVLKAEEIESFKVWMKKRLAMQAEK